MKRIILIAVGVLALATLVSAAGPPAGPGLHKTALYAGQTIDAGTLSMYNKSKELFVEVETTDGWLITEVQLFVGLEPPTTDKKANPAPGKFPFKKEFDTPQDTHTFVVDLHDGLDFNWGMPWEDKRIQYVALHADLVKLDAYGEVVAEEGAWAFGPEVEAEEGTWASEPEEFLGSQWGWWFTYELTHPRRAHFIDSPVGGLIVHSPTVKGEKTDPSGGHDYFPGESGKYYLGTQLLGEEAVLDKKVSPLDLFAGSDIDDPRVINLAMLLQSLDADMSPKEGIMITEAVEVCFDLAVGSVGYIEDWSYDPQVDAVVEATIDECEDVFPEDWEGVTREDAKIHLDETLNNAMFRKMISRTPDLGSAKAKMNIMPVWFPALRANGEPAVYNDANGAEHPGIPYYDEDGNLIRVATQAKPIIITFTDEDPVRGAHDAWAAVSRDDGNTWKRKNISRSGDRTSFTTESGVDYYGYCKKPVFQVKGNKILMAWTSKFAKGGKPAYSIDIEDDYTFDDPYYTDDIWGVGGPQRSVDYATEGFPEVGEVPYSAVWTCRGVVATQTDVDNGLGEFVGEIVWFKPERLTSARRDANLIFLAGAGGAGFGMVWQEDPKGLRPGRAVGPGPGWGGATTHHKTDIWYSYVTWGNHSKVDMNFVAGGDPEHDLDHIVRPKALVPMSLPIRLSDNDVLNEKNMGLDTTTYADDLSYISENLTRCVKFEDGKTIVESDSPDAWEADYTNLRAMPDDHQATMNCTNCHVPFGMDPMADIPTQGAPIPLVVIDAATQNYLGGFDNGDCVSCHFSNIVPRDRVIAMIPSHDEVSKCAECESKGGIWKDGYDGGEILEAYYPYEGYPYIYDDGDDPDGTHRYGLELPGLLVADPLTDTPDFFTFTNFAENETSVGITLGVDGIAGTADDLLMDGDTGAARGNIFLQPYVNAAGKTSAWAIITYEETKGAGSGPPDNTGESETHRDDYIPESGKNVIYHSFDFQNPDLVSAGDIMNMPEADFIISTDGYGNEIVEPVLDGSGNITPIYLETEAGVEIPDWKNRPQIAYENARRGRFILQGRGAIKATRTIMMMVYKMGMEGAGHPSDIMAHRWVVPVGDDTTVDNPYSFDNIVGNRAYDPVAEVSYWGSGPVNMSSVTPTVTTPSAGDPEWDDAYGAVKVVRWTQTADNLADLSDKNHYDDARAHRGQLRGDFVQLGFSYTPNWAASRNGNDNYDFFIRRSFNGGQTWTTDPAGSGVNHCITWTTPSGTESAGEKEEVCTDYLAGAHETMRNLSQLKNNKESVIEPRIVAVPGTIKHKVGGVSVWTGIPEDKQNQNVFYVAWGTSTNPKKDPITGEQEEPAPADLFYTFSMDKGETYFVDEWVVNPESDGTNAGETVYGTPWMAKGDQEQGEVQLRMTPDGSRFYASWLDEGEEGSDIVFRRIMSAEFPQNNATLTP